jgi:hypothetical protein
MTLQDSDPFIRIDVKRRIIVSVVAMNENNAILVDICNACKLNIIQHGTPSTSMKIPNVPVSELVESHVPAETKSESEPGIGLPWIDPSLPVATLQPKFEPSMHHPPPPPHRIQPAVLPPPEQSQ